MKMYQLHTEYADYDKVVIEKSEYPNGNTAIVLIDAEEGEEIAVLTVNLGAKLGSERQAYLDTNNFPEGEQFIKENNFGEMIGVGMSGFCTYPLYILDLEAMGVE